MVGEYGYRLRMFSPVGQLRGTLLVGKGLPDLTERPAAEAAQEAARVAKEIGVRPSPDSLRVSAVHSVAGIAVAKDGRVYLLIEAAAGGATPLVLDRFDPAGMMLERIALDRRLPTGHLSLAVGRDGLYLAGFTGSDGLWRLPWEALDGARWEGVPAATYNGEMAATINSMDRRAMS
jgi:hypothetical protein